MSELPAAIPYRSRYRWVLVSILFAFMLLHQSDKLLIGPLTTPIMEAFGINEAQMGLVFSGALIVQAVMYPLWGYLYDRFARPKLLALASLVWGATTWLGAIAPTYPTFVASRASTGVDDSSYPGVYSLVGDYFGPAVRGKIIGFLQITQPLGYMLGLMMASFLAAPLGWRGIFYVTGSLGIVLSVVIFFGVKEAPRGGAEPELRNLEEIGIYRFDKEAALALLKKPSLLFVFAQGFVGVFPWNVITYWFFRYLETERGYSSDQVFTTMAAAIAVLSVGYFVGGALGDALFERTRRGRLIVAMVAVLLGAILMTITMSVPVQSTTTFMIMLSMTALFIPFAAPNIISTVQDIALPEVRSTALAIHYVFDNGGAALSPLLAGLIAVRTSLGDAILYISVGAWLLTALLLAGAVYFVPRDIHQMREAMAERAATLPESSAT
ncbi:MAG: MFS transporter [Anaerolineales bacterium]